MISRSTTPLLDLKKVNFSWKTMLFLIVSTSFTISYYSLRLLWWGLTGATALLL